jgi:hypothetical protein
LNAKCDLCYHQLAYLLPVLHTHLHVPLALISMLILAKVVWITILVNLPTFHVIYHAANVLGKEQANALHAEILTQIIIAINHIHVY